MKVGLILECGIIVSVSLPTGNLPDVIVRGEKAWVYDDMTDHGMPIYRPAIAYVEMPQTKAKREIVQPPNFDVHFGGIA